MRLFVILSRVPYPLDKGDKLRAYHLIKELSNHHEVMVCALNDGSKPTMEFGELSALGVKVEVIQLNRLAIGLHLLAGLFSSKPFQVKYFYQYGAHKKVRKLIDKFKPDHIYAQLVRTAEYVKNEHLIPKTLDYMDAFSAGVERRISNASFFKRPFFISEYKRLLNYENLIFDYFEHHSIISNQDQVLIRHQDHRKIKVVSNGVNTDYFQATGQKQVKFDLVFTGNMSYPPNVACANYLVNQVLPLVWEKKPNITIQIAGSSPDKTVQELASDRVHISGWLDDIRDAYATAKIFVAPMQIGTGLQNKLLEAMAMRLPCVTSTLANNALGATPGNEVLVGDSADEIASHILNLIENKSIRELIGRAGYQYVTINFSWKSASDKLNQFFETRSK